MDKYNQLYKKYPYLTHMIYFETGEGWYDIIAKLCEQLSKYPTIYLVQVKEKFGELRVYTSVGGDDIYKYVEEAEEASRYVCEVCGSPGKLDDSTSWLKTVCEKHKNNSL